MNLIPRGSERSQKGLCCWAHKERSKLGALARTCVSALNLFEKVLSLTNNYPRVKIIALAYAGRIHADLKREAVSSHYYSQARYQSEMIGSDRSSTESCLSSMNHCDIFKTQLTW